MGSITHTHLLIKGQLQAPPTVESILEDWLTTLVKDISMKILDGPYVKYLNVVGNRGITGIVVIETSHCSVHIWDESSPSLVQMDVYSCADFDTLTVVNRLKDFDLVNYEAMRIDRNNDFKIIESYKG